MTTGQQSQPRRAVKPVGLLTIIAMLCVSAPGLASDYPPPPGPYPSGPLPVADGGEEITDRVRPGTIARPRSGERPGLLLPDLPDASESRTFGATNLFGSAPVATDPTPPPPPEAVFAPTDPTASYSPRAVEAAPPMPAPSSTTRDMTPGQQSAAGPQTYRPSTAAMGGGAYQPPAYPVGPVVPAYAAPTVQQQPWRGGPQYDAGPPAVTAQPAPPGGPVFRPPGSASN